MFDKLEEVVKRYEKLNEKLANPEIYDNQKEFKAVSVKNHLSKISLKIF